MGKGGMGVVYRAREIDTGREVALKVLAPELSRNATYIERFRREAKAVSRLDHPHIIKVYDVGETGGVYYFAMEYLAGPTLSDVLRQRGRLPVTEAVSIIVDIADAIDLAHLHGIIHRDIKPDNIMADEGGSFRIMDFGIAHMQEGTQLTVTGTIMGTPEYMSPEQSSGGAVDERSDIYSLGIVLYELLTGSVPFSGETAVEVLQMHRTKIPESPKLLNPDIPGRLAGVIDKMVEKNPANRYASFRHVINAIGQAIPPSVRTLVAAPTKQVQPKPVMKRERPGRRVRERVLLQTPTRVRIALASSILLNVLLFVCLTLRSGGPPESAKPMHSAFAIGGQMFAPPVVSDETIYLGAEDGTLYACELLSGDIQWTFKAGDKITAAPLIDGDRVYIGSWDQYVYALDAAAGEMIWKTRIDGLVFATPVLHHETLYVCTREGGVFAIDTETGKEKWSSRSGGSAKFSPSVQSGTVFVASDEGRLVAYRTIDGKPIGSLPTGHMKSSAVTSGQNIYFVAYDNTRGRDELCSVEIGPDAAGWLTRLGRLRWRIPLSPERNE
jgi:predicted Ser/Thr protein kinase